MTRVRCGAVSFNISNHLPPIGPSVPAKPVVLPPGCARLETNPSPTGSPTPTNTTGTFLVIGLSKARARLLNTMMTSGENASSSVTTGRISASPPVHQQPGPNTTDADRNCISNIRPEGIGTADAAFKVAHLLRGMRTRRLSGVRLKDDSDPLLLDGR